MISVLYVDDESDLLEISTRYLERTGDFTVDTAESAQAALEKIRTTSYDAIVSDYQMPDMDGIQLLKALRVSGDSTPLIIFTGKGREEVVIQAFENGADFYVQKGGELNSQFTELSHQIKKAVESRQAREALKDSEARFRTLFTISPDGIILFDLTGRITFVSPKALTMFRILSQDEAVGTSVLDWVDPEYHALVRGAMVQLLDGKFQRAITYRVRRRDGSLFFVESSQGIFPDANGHPGGIMVIIRDITDRQHAEMMLRESEENFRKIFESSALGMTLTMPDLRFLLVNPAWVSMIGYTEEELRKMSFKDITHPDDLPGNIEGIEALVAGRIPVYSTEKRYIRKDGSTLWGALNVSAVRNPNGKPRHCLAQIEDISSRKQAEEALRESEEKLALVMNGIPTLIAYIDTELRFVYINKAQREWYGLEEKDLIGKSLKDLLPEDVFSRAFPYYQQVLNGREVTFENPAMDRDGRERVLIVRLVPHVHGEKVVGFFAALNDVTERKETELAFQAMVRSTVGTTGLNSLHKIAASLSSWLGAECVMVGEIQPDKQTVRVLSMLLDGEYITDHSFLLKGSPCDSVVESGFCMYPDNVIHLFPESKILAELNVRGYMGTALRNSSGEVIGVLCVLSRNPIKPTPVLHEILDIIAVKAAAEIERSRIIAALQESEERFRMLLQHVPSVPVQGYNIYGTIQYWNEASTSLYGYTSEEAVGRNLVDLIIPPEMKDEIRKARAYMAESGQPNPASELCLMKKDGSRVAVFSSHAVVKRSGGALELFCIDIDLTELKRAEESVRESEAKLQMALSGSETGMWELGIPSMKCAIDDRAAQILGYQQKDIGSHKTDWDKLSHPEDAPLIQKRLDDCLEGRTPFFKSEHRMRHASGEWIWVFGKGRITHWDRDGSPLRISGTLRDVTERKRVEEALMEANKKMHLLSSITRHDINNQMTVLQGYLTLLEEKLSDPSFDDYFRRVETAAQRISAMIQFTKTYENIGANAPVWQDIRTIVETATKEVALGQIRLANDLTAGISMFTDPLIARVFFNLIDNSVRYGGKITTIRFFGEERDGSYLVVCEDDGVGIPDRVKERIFERGFGENTGLGLFLAREILSITGITIGETGEPGRGARFEITIPKAMYRFTTPQPGQMPERL